MGVLGQVTVHRTWNAGLLFVVYLMVRAWSLCEAASAGPHACPAVCSCSNPISKVVCTRRGLTRVPPGIPSNTRHLNLMENSIEQIQADTFRHLHHLEVLQLGRNSIRQIEVGAFNGLTSLNTLELFDNRLTVIPSGAFEYLSKLRELWLRNNPIESIPSYTFNRVPSLMRLDLGELRKLEYISEAAFKGLHNLKYLNLRMCKLREVPVLSPLVGLEELEVSENHFPIVRPGSFRGLKTLKKLWIMNSQVSLIERNAFDDVAGLVELNLAHNNLSSLPHDLFASLRGLVELHLHHNPWSCDCNVVWLSRWLQENIRAFSTCCGHCHTPPQMRGRYLVEVDRGTFQCSAPFISDLPRDLNISAERQAELRCRTAAMSSVRWLLPNGTILTHGSRHPRMTVANDGTLNFSNVLPSDTGVYTCMVANAAGSSNSSAFLNVSGAELNTSNLSYFTTVTVETLSPTLKPPDGPAPAAAGGDGPKSKSPTASPSVFQPAFISTPTVLLQSTPPPGGESAAPPVIVPTVTGSGKPPASPLDEVMKTTKIIIGCFVAVTLLAAVMLIAFYKLRKRHQQRSTVANSRIMDEDLPPPASACEGPSLPEIREIDLGDVPFKHTYSSSIYKPSHSPHWPDNSFGLSGCNSLHRSLPSTITALPEPCTIKTHAKDRVQETQI